MFTDWRHPEQGWWAAYTCPTGYYAAIPAFSHDDEDARLYGVGGVCRLDGVDGQPLVDSGGILAPSATDKDTYVVMDPERFASIVSDMDYISAEFVDALDAANSARMEVYARHGVTVDADQLPNVAPGDAVAFTSTPDDVEMAVSEAMLRTIDYDDVALAELARAMGWSLSETHDWIDAQSLGTIAELLPERADLPEHLLSRTSVGLRKQTWHMRVESSDGRVTFLHFGG